MTEGVVTGPGEGQERFESGARVALLKAGLPHLSVFEFEVHGDFEGPDPHTHDVETDSFYVLEGEIEFTVGEETFRAGPGTFVAAPPGVRHGFKKPPDVPRARFLNIHAPGGFEREMRRMSPR